MIRYPPIRWQGPRWLALLSFALLLARSLAAENQAPDLAPPAADNEYYLFGQSAALSGTASALGQGMRLGLLAAFEEANQAGGVHGRQLSLLSLDDAYEPEAAIANTRRLIDEHRVFAIVGATGTPTSRVTQPITRQADVPYIAPFTGADFLRDPQQADNVLNVRASYSQETARIVSYLVEELAITRIGVLYQNDFYGEAGLNGIRQALEQYELIPVAEEDYRRNTVSIKVPLLDLRRADPEAVVIIGAYMPAAGLIQWAQRLQFNPVFASISFVGTSALAEALGSQGEGVYITQVVPFPGDNRVPMVAAYQQALAALDPDSVPEFVSLEGYLAGRSVIEGLRRAGADATPASFMQTLRTAVDIDLGGFTLSYGPQDNQGSDRVWLTVIDASGQVQPVE